ncbi:MAG TPA: hypothetical protein PLE81_12985 [Brevundimonas sp.]|jgi:hypothetical protein|nr:hypothetical protein [Brevundimonas sp.]
MRDDAPGISVGFGFQQGPLVRIGRNVIEDMRARLGHGITIQ